MNYALGIAAYLATMPGSILVRMAAKPLDIYSEEIKRRPEAEAMTWQEAWDQSKDLVEARPRGHRALAEHMEEHPVGAEMKAMDKVVQVWASALELWHLSRSGRPPEEWHPHMGRGVAGKHT